MCAPLRRAHFFWYKMIKTFAVCPASEEEESAADDSQHSSAGMDEVDAR